jgi:hypothetical protein
LNACNTVRLGFALNFSVFQYDILKNHKKALELAENAINEALKNIDDINSEKFKDVKAMIDLIKENI